MNELDLAGAAPTVSPAATEASPSASPGPAPASGGAARPLRLPTDKVEALAILEAIPEERLNPRQRKKLTSLRRSVAAMKRAAGKPAAAAAPAAPAAEAPAAGDELEDDDRDDAQRKTETASFWRMLLGLVSGILFFFGYELEELTDKEAAEDAATLLPLVKRYRWLDVLVRWGALVYLPIKRVARKLRKREPKKDAAAAPPAAPALREVKTA